MELNFELVLGQAGRYQLPQSFQKRGYTFTNETIDYGAAESFVYLDEESWQLITLEGATTSKDIGKYELKIELMNEVNRQSEWLTISL